MTPAAASPPVPSFPPTAEDPAGLGLDDLDPGWARALAGVRPRLGELSQRLAAEPERWLPAPGHVLRAFRQPFDAVRVLLVGQDPYPTPGHPIGLSFAVEPHVRPLPRSLVNVYKELAADTGVQPPPHGDLTAWSEAGVLLLNRVMTVRAGDSGSHRKLGWQAVTDAAVSALAARGGPLVALLWGKDAQTVTPLLEGVPVVAGVHPSPLSASRGFFGSRPFSRVDALLREEGGDGIDWRLT
ncbi:uracil-DNA glycosylase [Kineococcus radiotolerans]|uniref:Uracil-DNA glycosylase n=2 Tax=Kineococcus radiotolerans TaxID=131568 RepID=A6WE63_KINRD|nr:uracil-DNA glycosylase [Kineococcus radiotolerans]ABS05102.1 Uracil-DNA glycosylase superfamily [Kineococcus radiotolerans SRS30216 = ATCC BAA-149]MBB2901956.1 uracil-DNA glycosylase [Kineococcus radiotolerans]